MASRLKFERIEKLLMASNNTINDLLKENYELKKQMQYLISKQNENKDDRRTMDFTE